MTKAVYLPIAFIGFLLSIFWENLHISLYSNYAEWMEQIYFLLCALGDVMLIFLVYFLVAVIFRNTSWIYHFTATKVATTLVISAVVSVMAEKIALIMDWWQYSDQMPLVPFLNIGLSPFLAIVLLPILSFLITKKINQLF